MLEDGDATWDSRGSSGGVCYYDVIQFVVSAAGPYTFTNFYPGDVPTDMNLDGFLRLFANVFNRLDPGSFIAFDDDYSGPEFGGVCVGQNCSQIANINLNPGTTYFMAVTSFTDTPNSFGQPTGEWQLDGMGEGTITVVSDMQVPEPAPLLLISIGLMGLTLSRRLSQAGRQRK